MTWVRAWTGEIGGHDEYEGGLGLGGHGMKTEEEEEEEEQC